MKNLTEAGRRVSPSPSYLLIPIGTKFGYWEVIDNTLRRESGERLRPACLVRCKCGIEAIRTFVNLRSGTTLSCGCRKINSVHPRPVPSKRRYKAWEKAHPLIPIGTRFSSLTVIENDLHKGPLNRRACRVRCDCGIDKVVGYNVLRTGETTSCGCKKLARPMESVWNQLHHSFRRRGWDVHLTIPELKIATQLPCVYCGKEPENVFRPKYKSSRKSDGSWEYVMDPSKEIRWSGLDRVDSTKGYIHGNVVPACRRCNLIKNDMPVDEFLSLIGTIIERNPNASKIHQQASGIFDVKN